MPISSETVETREKRKNEPGHNKRDGKKERSRERHEKERKRAQGRNETRKRALNVSL